MALRRCLQLFCVLVCLSTLRVVVPSSSQDLSNEPSLSREQKEDFLLRAEIAASRQLGTGVTHPWRLTLSDGTLTHDAVFQSVDIRSRREEFASGRVELNFRDSYHFNIAGYELARLLGLDDMIPVTVERKWRGKTGSLSWWVPWKWMESDRLKQNLHPPDLDAWNKQMHKVRVFNELIYDTDPNLTNILIAEDWRIWRIDFTRAFRLHNDLQNPRNLERCDRQLLEKLRQLNADEILQKTKSHLTKSEAKALMARRDRIVAHFERLIAQKGEAAVLY